MAFGQEQTYYERNFAETNTVFLFQHDSRWWEQRRRQRISNRVNPDDDLDDLFICINTSVGADAARVQRVHLHPLKFGNGYNAPILNQLRVLGYSYHILIWKLKSWFWCKRGSAPNYAPPVLWNPCICPLHNVLDPLISTQFWKSEHK